MIYCLFLFLTNILISVIQNQNSLLIRIKKKTFRAYSYFVKRLKKYFSNKIQIQIQSLPGSPSNSPSGFEQPPKVLLNLLFLG